MRITESQKDVMLVFFLFIRVPATCNKGYDSFDKKERNGKDGRTGINKEEEFSDSIQTKEKSGNPD